MRVGSKDEERDSFTLRVRLGTMSQGVSTSWMRCITCVDVVQNQALSDRRLRYLLVLLCVHNINPSNFKLSPGLGAHSESRPAARRALSKPTGAFRNQTGPNAFAAGVTTSAGSHRCFSSVPAWAGARTWAFSVAAVCRAAVWDQMRAPCLHAGLSKPAD